MDFKLSLRELLQTLCPALNPVMGVGRIHPGSSGMSQHGKGFFASPVLPGTSGTIPEHLPVPSPLVPVQLRVAGAWRPLLVWGSQRDQGQIPAPISSLEQEPLTGTSG